MPANTTCYIPCSHQVEIHNIAMYSIQQYEKLTLCMIQVSKPILHHNVLSKSDCTTFPRSRCALHWAALPSVLWGCPSLFSDEVPCLLMPCLKLGTCMALSCI